MIRRPVCALAPALFALVCAAPASAARTLERGSILRIDEREAPGLDAHLSIPHTWLDR